MTADLPIFVINLDRVPDRIEEVRAQFDAVGLADHVRRFSAVDASAAEFTAPGYAPASWHDRWSLLASEQAIFESHRAVWQRVIDDGLPGAVICEDDILVSDSFPTSLASLELERFGIVKLDGFYAARRYGPPEAMETVSVRPICEHVPSAACYAISRTAAAALLSDSQQYCMTLDDFAFMPRAGIHPAQIFPAVAVQAMCVADAGVVRVMASSERGGDAMRAGGKANKGPVLFRLRKELTRLKTRLSRKMGGDTALLAAGGIIARPDLAPDLPPYRQ
ncbi:glycosyltransferase family 25 protein [Phaeobacter marinintestinus]|uniref:glycosyltransferase family 25 protein n=1 Tax=Falsiphaeobacter marinintestinus TaxID=1492905 RepID=UPI0011B71B24|nr:glycosyltransferase family 25 protein [Phaeobacter marinintestinus]